MDRAREGGTLVTCINSPTPARQEKSRAQFRGPGVGGTLVTCINSPTPGQEKSRAQFRGPGERGRNSSYLYKFLRHQGKRRAGHSSVDRAREGGTLVTCINSSTPGQEKSRAQFRGPALVSREGGTLVTCINSPTPGQEKSRAQFRGPGERGRNSSYLYKFPDTCKSRGTVPWTGRD